MPTAPHTLFALLLASAALCGASYTLVDAPERLQQRRLLQRFRAGSAGTAPLSGLAGLGAPGGEPLARIWDAVPEFAGHCSPGDAPAQWEDATFAYSVVTKASGRDVILEFHLKRKAIGVASYLLVTAGGLHLHTFVLAGTHVVHLKSLTDLELEDVALAGVRAYRFHGAVASVESLAELAWLLVAVAETKVYTPWTNEQSLEFMSEYLDYHMQRRSSDAHTLSSSDVHPGDVIAIMRLDGLDPLVAWVTGGRVAHMAIVWELEGRKVVCESQAAMYWPVSGIQCNEWDQWVQWADKAEYNAVLMPLAPEYRARLNVSAGVEWFRSVEGLPYGYQSFLAAGFDTIYGNLPKPLNPMTLELFGAVTHAFAAKEGSAILCQSVSKRVGLAENSTWPQVLVAAERQYGTLMQSIIQPERADYTYGGSVALVCSSFASEMLRRSGVLAGYDFNAVEMTPADVVALRIYDRAYSAPGACAGADPESAAAGYCQITGRYRVDLGSSFNTWQPHDHMSEHCASYDRTPLC
eukprot:m51a1_g6270 hypothetical protein (523) ;mRNA; f:143866-146043